MFFFLLLLLIGSMIFFFWRGGLMFFFLLLLIGFQHKIVQNSAKPNTKYIIILVPSNLTHEHQQVKPERERGKVIREKNKRACFSRVLNNDDLCVIIVFIR
jgi:hypothetical protein